MAGAKSILDGQHDMITPPNDLWQWLTDVLRQIANSGTALMDVGVSDIHLLVGSQPLVRRGGEITPIAAWNVKPEHIDEFLQKLLRADQRIGLREKRVCDATYMLKDVAIGGAGEGSAFRIHCFYQRDSIAIAIRRSPPVTSKAFAFEELGIPPGMRTVLDLHEGLVLLTGPTGAGKSTSMAAMIDHINQTRACRILTIEDPVEYYHKHAKSYVMQQEVGRDVLGFAQAVTSALRQDVDVVMVGEMRDLETVRAVMHIAGTGHLALATFHAGDVTEATEQMISMFPVNEQAQFRLTLARVLRAVLAQVLVPKKDGKGRVLATEFLQLQRIHSDMITNCGKPGELRSQMRQDEVSVDLRTFNKNRSGYTRLLDLYRLCRDNVIDVNTALEYAGADRHNLNVELAKLPTSR